MNVLEQSLNLGQCFTEHKPESLHPLFVLCKSTRETISVCPIKGKSFLLSFGSFIQPVNPENVAFPKITQNFIKSY